MLQKPEELLQKSKTYKENVQKNHSRVFGLWKNPEKWKPSNFMASLLKELLKDKNLPKL